jgi:hypothetical protein
VWLNLDLAPLDSSAGFGATLEAKEMAIINPTTAECKTAMSLKLKTKPSQWL